MTSSAFFTGIAGIRRACSRQDGNWYSRNLKKVLMAASLDFRSTKSSDGVTFSLLAAKQTSSWKA